jgi:hypothetical protein
MVSGITAHPCHTSSWFVNPGTVNYNTTFHQQVCDVPIWLDTCVHEMVPSCMSIVLSPLETPGFTHACYRCDRTAFFEALATMSATVFAQVVLTLRSVFFYSDCSVMLITARPRIYAVTRKNRIITSCFVAITISQFIVGIYATGYAATRGCESVTKCCSQILPTLIFQRYRSYLSHFRFI